ncbi:hypothetical protein [Sulfurihydrogenibium subterraneum]|uniref:hypothetical protein n=1 Tax=Sulfurihydrogenibium subterraneum TaxID=171121 RepID=UPI00048BBCAC|nr:hypothetical protein [Sulfurihydrogenibium subterraneum]
MEVKDEIFNLLNKVYNDTKLYYVGVFVKGKVFVSKYTGSFQNIESNFARMIERSLEIEEAIKNFNAEFLFSENKNKDFSMFVYYISKDIAIGMIHIGKPNFSLLKVAASDLAKEIKPFEKQLIEIYEKQLKDKESDLNEKEFNLDKKETPVSFKKNEMVKEEVYIDSNITELEKVLTSNVLDEEVKQIKTPDLLDILKEDTKEDSIKSQENIDIVNTPPNLSEILTEGSLNNQESENIDIEKVLNEIGTIFIKYIGPFGKFLFNKKRQEFFKTNTVNKFSVVKFFHNLAEEIPDNKKREMFVKECKEKLLNI